MFPGIFARPWRVVAVLLVVALVGAGFWLWHRAGSSTPVSEEDALGAFREGGGAAGAGRVAPGVPAPGVYTFAQSGSEEGGAGPLEISRGLPGQARYTVIRTADGYREELAISREHVEGVTVRVRPRASWELARRTRVTFLGFGRDDRRRLRPPPVRLVRPLTVGRSWRASYSAGTLPVTSRSVVLRQEVVVVGGRRYAARVVRTVGDTGGAHPGRRVDVIWWSPALALPLRWEIDMEIGGPATLRTRARLELESVTPQV